MTSIGVENSIDFSDLVNKIGGDINNEASGQGLHYDQVFVQTLMEMSGVEGMQANGLGAHSLGYVNMDPSSQIADTMFIDIESDMSTEQMQTFVASLNSMIGSDAATLNINDNYSEYDYTIEVPISAMSEIADNFDMDYKGAMDSLVDSDTDLNRRAEIAQEQTVGGPDPVQNSVVHPLLKP